MPVGIRGFRFGSRNPQYFLRSESSEAAYVLSECKVCKLGWSVVASGGQLAWVEDPFIAGGF